MSTVTDGTVAPCVPLLTGDLFFAYVQLMPNQRTIAAALGITQSTVARALRGSPLVNSETRRRVEEAARELGYRPNPMVTVLMEHIRTGKDVHDQGSIAILGNRKPKEGWSKTDGVYKLQCEGIVSRANRLGFRTESFYLQKNGMTNDAMDRILYNRGFSGIILASPAVEKESFNLRFERYAVAGVGDVWNSIAIDQASTDHVSNVTFAFNELLKRGYKRIGMALPSTALELEGPRWMASYLNHQYHQPRSCRIPVFEGTIHNCSIDKFRHWYDRWKPDALLSLLGEELDWMKEMGLSPLEDMGLACLNRPLESEFSGVEENSFLVGELACDIVINHIIHNERGLSQHPYITRVQGTWVEGNTLPRRNPNAG